MVVVVALKLHDLMSSSAPVIIPTDNRGRFNIVVCCCCLLGVVVSCNMIFLRTTVSPGSLTGTKIIGKFKLFQSL